LVAGLVSGGFFFPLTYSVNVVAVFLLSGESLPVSAPGPSDSAALLGLFYIGLKEAGGFLLL